MAILFADSFDDRTGAAAGTKGWDSGGSGSCSTTVARHGSQSMLVAATGSGRQHRNLPSSYATLLCGFGVYLPTSPNNSIIFGFRDSGTNHIYLTHGTNGKLRAFRGDGTSLGDGTLTISNNVWYYIEVKVTFHDSTGIYQVKVNGASGFDINLSSIDTKNTANATANQIFFEQGPAGIYVDDVVVLDTSGSAPQNDFLGDIAVTFSLPNGDGNYSQFDGSDGNQTNNSLLVDEANPNGDTDYVESGDVGDKDTYAMESVSPTTGTVYGVQTSPYVKKTDAGAISLKNLLRLSSTDLAGASQTLSTTYAFYPEVFPEKPGGGAFTISDLNALEAGYEVAA